MDTTQMNYKDFKIIIETLEKIRERSHVVHTLGIDMTEYEESYHIVTGKLMEAVFTEEGVDWINWYLYERPGFGNTPNKATDKDGNEICHNVESLWETVKPYRKQ